MKSKHGFIIAFLIVIFTSPDCTKDPEYLDKYFGSWSFEYSWSRQEIHLPATGDTTYYTGEIVPGPCKSCVTITPLGKSFKVEPDGQILNTCEPPSFPPHYQKYCSGYFEGDSIFHYETFDRTPPNHIVTNVTILSGRKL